MYCAGCQILIRGIVSRLPSTHEREAEEHQGVSGCGRRSCDQLSCFSVIAGMILVPRVSVGPRSFRYTERMSLAAYRGNVMCTFLENSRSTIETSAYSANDSTAMSRSMAMDTVSAHILERISSSDVTS